MSINTSIKSRVKRLEQLEVEARALNIAERLRLAHERRLAMSPAELAAHEAQHLADCIAALSEPDLQGDEGRVQRIRRRFARRHLESATA